jgi:hypothetical protein
MGQLLSSLLDIFYTKKLDIVVIGLENRYVKLTENAEGSAAVAYLTIDLPCCRYSYVAGRPHVPIPRHS